MSKNDVRQASTIASKWHDHEKLIFLLHFCIFILTKQMIQTQRTLYQNVIITLVGYSTHCFPTEYNGSTPNPGRSANPYGVVMVQPSHGGNLMSFIRNSTAAPCSCGQPQIVASSSCRFTVVPRRTRVPDRASTIICKQFW